MPAPAVLLLLAVGCLPPRPALRGAKSRRPPSRSANLLVLRAARWISRISSFASSRAAARRWWTFAGSSPSKPPVTGWPPAVALEEGDELALGNTGENGRIGDLVAVEMQHRQHRAVGRRVQELVRVPACGQRPGFGLAVAHDTGNQELRIVEGRPKGVHKRVAELAALMDRSRHLGRNVARDASWEGDCRKSCSRPASSQPTCRVQLAVGALRVGVRHQSWPTVARHRYVDRALVAAPDLPVRVRASGGRGPAPFRSGRAGAADVLRTRRLAQECVVEQIRSTRQPFVISHTPVHVCHTKVITARRGRLGHQA